jgi:hypothetical protein
MLDYGSLRDVFKDSSRINSEHLVLAEWNMNKYQTISQYGVYVNPLRILSTVYNKNDSSISSGSNHLIYDDGTTKVPADQEYFSQLASIFKPNRPDPGILLMQKYGNNLITSNASRLRSVNVNPYQPRYYPFSEFREYDYWNSAKNFVLSDNTTITNGLSDPRTGDYGGGLKGAAQPFVVYEDIFPCNKITIKVQNHISVPVQFSIEILQETAPNVFTWNQAYTVSQSSSADFETGELNVYYDPTSSSWVKVSPNTDIGTYVIDSLESLDDSSPIEFKLIKGIRFVVHKMSIVKATTTNQFNVKKETFYPAAIELVEISPRLEVNLSEYTEDFSFDSRLGDTTNFGLPVGSIVASTGSLSLSNEDGIFLFSGKLSKLNMLSPDVKFMFYQIINSDGTDKAIPLKVLYSNRWDISEDYSVSISLEDGFKFLRETSAPDILLHSQIGQPLSIVILFLLDNAGITNYQFKKSDNDADSEDTLIRSFFSKREQTVAEVLEELAIATQCSMYFDAIGKFNVLTKERLTKKVPRRQSGSATTGTDFWMILDEDYTGDTGNVSEYSSVSSYTANVVSYSETQLNPTTDGDIVYHTYGPPKKARLDEFPEKVLNRLTEQTAFPASLAFANFGYNTDIVWNAADGGDGSLGAANLESDLDNKKLQTMFTETYTADNEEEAVRLLYRNGTTAQKNAMIIKLDQNEGLTINPYQGAVLVGTEFIKYNGKLVKISSTPNQNNSLQIPVNTNKILFSAEEFLQEIRNIGTGGSIRFIGLVVDVKFKIVGQTDNRYRYKVIGDGRGKLGSEIQKHNAFVEENDGLKDELKYGLALGDKYNQNFPVPKTSVKQNFLERSRYKSAYRQLQKRGLLSKFSNESYLGFLKMSGLVNTRDQRVTDKLYSEGADQTSIAKELAEINKQTDEKVPGDFDDFVYYEGERNIYGQKINLGFKPNVISTRMRLFSPRRRRVNNFLAAETLSSIAGIAFGVNRYGEGYYLEVEGVGSGKDSVAKESFKTNLRFYKVTINKNGVYEPNLIFSAPVGAYVVENIDVQVIKSVKGNIDPYFDLSIVIDYPQNGSLARYTVRYGDKRIGRFTESKSEAINGNTVALFVRGDSQAIFEYISAAARPLGLGDIALYKGFNRIDEKVKAGILPINQQYLYKNDQFTYYFNDFAKLVREVKEYDVRFQFPAYVSRLIDVSEVNSQYMIKKYIPTAFGARLVVINTSPGPIVLTQESNNPLYVVAVPMEELSSGTVNMESFIDVIEEKRTKALDREKNKSIYGSQSFTIDSQYLQTLSQAKKMMGWIIRYCSRPRIQLNLEIFSNSLLELGDKVKIYDKSRGYNQDNPRFGNKTFVVSAINHAVDNNGPSMNVEIIEVGEA